MTMKQPTLAAFNFKRSSSDQNGLSLSTSGENTNACSLIPDVRDLQKKKKKMFHFSCLSQFDLLRSDKKNGTMHL